MVLFSKGSKQDRKTKDSTGRMCIYCHVGVMLTPKLMFMSGLSNVIETHVIIGDELAPCS